MLLRCNAGAGFAGRHRLGAVEVGLAHREGRSRAAEREKVRGHPLEGVEVGLAHREGRSRSAEREKKMRGHLLEGVEVGLAH